MNAETMKLYKEENINMYGSCLPLLVQMPLLLRLLSRAGQCDRAAPGALGMAAKSGAVADPWHILPILIIASMFLVQFITPSPGMDPRSGA
jgi:YidC/Oxa1 family membrane protein insertase